MGTQSAELISNFAPEEMLVVDQNEEGTQIRRLEKDELKAWIGDKNSFCLFLWWLEKNILEIKPLKITVLLFLKAFPRRA